MQESTGQENIDPVTGNRPVSEYLVKSPHQRKNGGFADTSLRRNARVRQ